MAHGIHGTHGRIFDRRERSERRAEKLTGAEGGGLAAKRRKGRKNRMDDGKADAGGRRTEGGPTEHTEHTEEFLTGGNGVIGGRRVFPAHVGATADRRSQRDTLSRPRNTRNTRKDF